MQRFLVSNTTYPWLFDLGMRNWDRLVSALAIAVLVLWTWDVMLATNASSDNTQQQTASSDADRSTLLTPGQEHIIAGYGGAPYLHPSDVVFTKPGATDFTARRVAWEGRPFQNPIFYGIRTIHWTGKSPFGAMLDFMHSKAISLRDQEIRMSGTRDGKKVPDKARVGDVFRHFEFSHGHNTLTLNGIVRLANLVPRVGPYIGAGAGIAIPHTEVHFAGDNIRTYEYQYVGPAVQALIGLELRLPRVSVFVEYKFSIASYKAPLTNRDGGWFPEDFWRQFRGFLRGETPAGGYLSTTIASHNVVAGVGGRFVRAP